MSRHAHGVTVLGAGSRTGGVTRKQAPARKPESPAAARAEPFAPKKDMAFRAEPFNPGTEKPVEKKPVTPFQKVPSWWWNAETDGTESADEFTFPEHPGYDPWDYVFEVADWHAAHELPVPDGAQSFNYFDDADTADVSVIFDDVMDETISGTVVGDGFDVMSLVNMFTGGAMGGGKKEAAPVGPTVDQQVQVILERERARQAAEAAQRRANTAVAVATVAGIGALGVIGWKVLGGKR